jgi:hypothetical protein
MGRKRTKVSKKVVKITETKVIKFSYLQTLAVSKDLLSPESAETRGFKTKETSLFKRDLERKLERGKKINLVDEIVGKKRNKNKTIEIKRNGSKVKDSYFHPYYDRIRYAIGIRELSVSRYKFAERSEIKSVPFVSPKEIIKVSLLVDEYIPSEFDRNSVWVKYYIKVEGQDKWVRLSPLNSPTRFDEAGDIVPKIVNFNIPRPTTAQLEDKFNFTDEPVKQIRFRAVLSRPTGVNLDSMTPMLKSYRLIMLPRE